MKIAEAYLKISSPKKEQKQFNSLYTNLSHLQQELHVKLSNTLLISSRYRTQTSKQLHLYQSMCCNQLRMREKQVLHSLIWLKAIFCAFSHNNIACMFLAKYIPFQYFFFTVLGFCDLQQVNISTRDFGLSYLKMHCLIYWYKHMHFINTLIFMTRSSFIHQQFNSYSLKAGVKWNIMATW